MSLPGHYLTARIVKPQWRLISAGLVTANRPGISAVIRCWFCGQVAAVSVSNSLRDSGAVRRFVVALNQIDRFAIASWQQLGVVPAESTTDADFLRRVFLDVIGVLPTPDEIRAFISDPHPDKRLQIVGTVFWTARNMSTCGRSAGAVDLLRVHSRFLGEKGVASFRGWIRQSVRDNKPLTQWARELIVSQGNLFTSGPVAYYFVDEKPEELAENHSSGVSWHPVAMHEVPPHHPNEVWSQEDYYEGLAAFFTRLEKKDTLDQGRFGGARSVRPVLNDVPARKLTAAAATKTSRPGTTTAAYRDRTTFWNDLAVWMTARNNPFFAKNFANRYWGWMMGCGLVEPVDDLAWRPTPLLILNCWRILNGNSSNTTTIRNT